tara:strand:+ start:47 stop:496 length:450 start_codon:yes stop_codon:yes gene_type:complete
MDRDKLVKEIIQDEGFEYQIYLDHLGYPTFGVGHLVTSKDKEHGQPVGTPVSEERILECLNYDIDIVCMELDKNMPWWKDLDDDKQRVLANMAFNLGLPRLGKFKKFLKAMEEGDFQTAAVEMMDSKWATQVGNRAKRLRDRVADDPSI